MSKIMHVRLLALFATRKTHDLKNHVKIPVLISKDSHTLNWLEFIENANRRQHGLPLAVYNGQGGLEE